MNKYYFYTDPTKITTPQLASQAFGPAQIGNPSALGDAKKDKYRTTNLHTATDAPAIAVCDGMICVQEDDLGTYSIILKPNYQPPFDFPFIKYFIYKGIKKDSIVSGNSVDFTKSGDIPFINVIDGSWEDTIGDPAVSNPRSDSAKVLGLDYESPFDYDIDGTLVDIFHDNQPIDNFFYYPNPNFQLPSVKAGDKIGLFDTTFGFEIVLERLGYEPKIELTRTFENFVLVDAIADPLNIINTWQVDDADYFLHWHEKEQCLNYIDPCAFYGSFCGTKVFYYTDADPKVKCNSPQDIYDNLLKKVKFINRNLVYLDLRCDQAYSFGYFLDKKKLNLTYNLIVGGEVIRNLYSNIWTITTIDTTVFYELSSKQTLIFNLNLSSNSLNDEYLFYQYNGFNSKLKNVKNTDKFKQVVNFENEVFRFNLPKYDDNEIISTYLKAYFYKAEKSPTFNSYDDLEIERSFDFDFLFQLVEPQTISDKGIYISYEHFLSRDSSKKQNAIGSISTIVDDDFIAYVFLPHFNLRNLNSRLWLKKFTYKPSRFFRSESSLLDLFEELGLMNRINYLVDIDNGSNKFKLIEVGEKSGLMNLFGYKGTDQVVALIMQKQSIIDFSIIKQAENTVFGTENLNLPYHFVSINQSTKQLLETNLIAYDVSVSNIQPETGSGKVKRSSSPTSFELIEKEVNKSIDEVEVIVPDGKINNVFFTELFFSGTEMYFSKLTRENIVNPDTNPARGLFNLDSSDTDSHIREIVNFPVNYELIIGNQYYVVIKCDDDLKSENICLKIRFGITEGTKYTEIWLGSNGMHIDDINCEPFIRSTDDVYQELSAVSNFSMLSNSILYKVRIGELLDGNVINNSLFNNLCVSIESENVDVEVNIICFPEDNSKNILYGNDLIVENGMVGSFPSNNVNDRIRIVNRTFYLMFHEDIVEGTTNIDALFNRDEILTGNQLNNVPRLIKKWNNNSNIHNTYIYVDRNGNRNHLCERDIISTLGKELQAIPNLAQRGNLLETIDYSTYISASEQIWAKELKIYENGTLGIKSTYSSKPNRWYANLEEEVKLVDMDVADLGLRGPEVQLGLNYISEGMNIRYGFRNTRRRYCNPDVFAAFLASVARLSEINTHYITGEGFCYPDASSYPSVKHINGVAGDLYYLSTSGNGGSLQLGNSNFDRTHQEYLLRILYNYGFGRSQTMVCGTSLSLIHCRQINDHNDHLHVEGFSLDQCFKILTIKQ